jgi:hypothetical protein
MARGFYKALNIESGEESSVMLLIFQSVFLGVFYGTFDISAHALFLEIFEQAMIPRAFLVSGVIGIIMTSGYAWLQSRIRFPVFSVLNLALVAILTILLRFGFNLMEVKWIVFGIFIMMGPLNIVALLGFWGTVGRIYTLRQGKRLFGLIDTGQIVGIILSSYAIPVLLSLQVETRDLLYISALSAGIALVFQFIISSRFSMDTRSGESGRESESRTSLFSMLRSRYIGYMSLFVVLLISVTIFVHFSFLGVARESYPDHTDLAAFFGYFNGTLMVFSVLIKTFVYGRLMKTWGLKLTLVISPILLLIFTGVAAVIGGVFGLAATFTMFFLIISVSKLFTKSLQDSIVAPSMKILYQSLDARIRYGVQARIDGTINEISVLVSSLLASGLVALSFFSLVHYSYVLIILLVAWAFIAFRLYQAYQRSLNDSLVKFRQSGKASEKTDMKSILSRGLSSSSMPEVGNALHFMEITDFEGFQKALSGLLKSASSLLRRLSLRKIDELNIPIQGNELEEEIKLENSGNNRDIAGGLMNKLEEYRKRRPADEALVRMAKSSDRNDRIAVVMALFEGKEFRQHAVLNTLLVDPDPVVRSAAIQAAAFWKVPQAVPVLIDLLSTPYYRQAFDALVKTGEEAVENLEESYFKTGIHLTTLLRITSILGKIGHQRAVESLASRIGYQDREVEHVALQCLIDLKFRASEKELPRIIDAMRSTAQQIAWNLSARYTIVEKDLGESLEKAIREELDISYDRLFKLLSIAYDANSIFHIRENLESGTSEGIGFAIELLDIFVADEIKPVLFPLLEDTSVVEKIRKLQVEFPILIMDPPELLTSMINRDPNLLGTIAKGAAIQQLGRIEGTSLSDDLIAQVFNPDELLSELAVIQVASMDPSRLENVLDRIIPGTRERLERSLKEAERGGENLIWQKIQILLINEYLSTLPSKVLYKMALKMDLLQLEEGQSMDLAGREGRTVLGLIKSGELVLKTQDRDLGKAGSGELIGILPLALRGKEFYQVLSTGETWILAGDRQALDEFIFDHEELAMALYRWARDQESSWAEVFKEMVS